MKLKPSSCWPVGGSSSPCPSPPGEVNIGRPSQTLSDPPGQPRPWNVQEQRKRFSLSPGERAGVRGWRAFFGRKQPKLALDRVKSLTESNLFDGRNQPVRWPSQPIRWPISRFEGRITGSKAEYDRFEGRINRCEGRVAVRRCESTFRHQHRFDGRCSRFDGRLTASARVDGPAIESAGSTVESAG